MKKTLFLLPILLAGCTQPQPLKPAPPILPIPDTNKIQAMSSVFRVSAIVGHTNTNPVVSYIGDIYLFAPAHQSGVTLSILSTSNLTAPVQWHTNVSVPLPTNPVYWMSNSSGPVAFIYTNMYVPTHYLRFEWSK